MIKKLDEWAVDVCDKNKGILSILICSIPERMDSANALVNDLSRWCEVLVDDRDRTEISGITVGEKRQSLMERATGKYIIWVDDDDSVIPLFPAYIIDELKGVEDLPDVITFKQRATINGIQYIVDSSINYQDEQLHEGEVVKRKPTITSVWRKDIAMQGKFPHINNGEDAAWQKQLKPKTEIHIDKVLHFYNYDDRTTAASKEQRRAVVSFANGSYKGLIDRQRKSVENFSQAKYVNFSRFEEIESPEHGEFPYSFKAHSIHREHRNGSNVILLIDSPLYAVKDFTHIFDLIVKHGVLLVDNVGWTIHDYTSDQCLKQLGMERDTAKKKPMAMACIMGFDMRNDKARHVFNEYLHWSKQDAIKGDWTNEFGQVSADKTVRGHRHDQSIISILAEQNGIKMHHPKGVIAYARLDEHKEWINDAVFISDRSL